MPRSAFYALSEYSKGLMRSISSALRDSTSSLSCIWAQRYRRSFISCSQMASGSLSICERDTKDPKSANKNFRTCDKRRANRSRLRHRYSGRFRFCISRSGRASYSSIRSTGIRLPANFSRLENHLTVGTLPGQAYRFRFDG